MYGNLLVNMYLTMKAVFGWHGPEKVIGLR